MSATTINSLILAVALLVTALVLLKLLDARIKEEGKANGEG